ncbi:MAG: hypothetical protein JXR70_15340 [Spirochaetales bacterium]|nr:hypothetical protein [Spirochaetales bacterium]
MSAIFDASKIQIKWVGISIIVFIVAQALIMLVFGIANVFTLGIFRFLLNLILPPLVYLGTGYITGRISPGITIFEPAIGSGLIVTLSSFLGFNGRLNLVLTILLAALAFILSLVGAYIGEKQQLNKNKEA